MLKTRTEKQKGKIESILSEHQIISFEEHGVSIDGFVSYDQMAEIVDYLRTSVDKHRDLFEECWVAYGRKGIKNKAKDYWNKLEEKDIPHILPHIKVYVTSREKRYQKDFERYLRDKVFLEVIYNGNNIVYDPSKKIGSETKYMPQCGGALNWNEYFKCYIYTGYWDGHIPDGYTDDDRPDGVEITLNNGRGTIVWNSLTKQWNKK